MAAYTGRGKVPTRWAVLVIGAAVVAALSVMAVPAGALTPVGESGEASRLRVAAVGPILPPGPRADDRGAALHRRARLVQGARRVRRRLERIGRGVRALPLDWWLQRQDCEAGRCRLRQQPCVREPGTLSDSTASPLGERGSGLADRSGRHSLGL